MARLSDRGFTSTRGLSYTLADTAANVDAALPITHGLGALPSSLELWVEVSAGQWEQQDPATYVTASTTALIGTGTTLASVVGGSTNVRLVAAAGAVALSVAEASASQPGIVSTGAQTIAGAKTFSDDLTVGSSALFVDVSTSNVGIGTPSPGIGAEATSTYLTISRTSGATPISRFELNGNRTGAGLTNSSIDGYVNSNLFTRIESLTGATATSGILQFRTYTSNGAASTVGIKIEEGAVTLGPSGGDITHNIYGQTLLALNNRAGEEFTLDLRALNTNGTSVNRAQIRVVGEASGPQSKMTFWTRQSDANLTEKGSISSAGAWTLPLIHNIGAGNITSGRYTPTLTSVSNIASATAQSSHYSRVGNTVTVAIWLSPISATAAAGTITRIRVSLPIASNFTSLSDALGTANFFRPTATTAEAAGMVLANVAGNDLEIYWRAPTTSAGDVLITAQYEVK